MIKKYSMLKIIDTIGLFTLTLKGVSKVILTEICRNIELYIIE